MICRIVITLILTMILTSCGAAAATQAPATAQSPCTATEAPVEPIIVEASPTLEPTQTFTPEPTYTPSVTPTETPLPPLELPTEMVNAPALLVWDGKPTYLGDLQPGFYFRVSYDPNLWALTADQFGYPAIGHRNIPYCVISVTSGRGLPPDISVEHDILYTGNVTFNVGTAYEGGVKKFVTYTGGDGRIITGFEVSFEEQSDKCIADAVTVLSTLRSVPISQATPEP